ncbi:hypothetical protein LTS17_010200 [Exophiala oligosperma]
MEVPVTVANPQSLAGHIEHIRDLYLTRRRTLTAVRQELLKEYSLSASESQLKRILNKRRVGKNHKGIEWVELYKMLRHLGLDSSQATIAVDGTVLTTTQIERAFKRHVLPTLSTKLKPDHIPPRTPGGWTIDRKWIKPAAITANNLPCHYFWDQVRKFYPRQEKESAWVPSASQIVPVESSVQHSEALQPDKLHIGTQFLPGLSSLSQVASSSPSTPLGLGSNKESVSLVMARELDLDSHTNLKRLSEPLLIMTKLTMILPASNNFLEDMRLTAYAPGATTLPVLFSYLAYLCSNRFLRQTTFDALANTLLEEYGLDVLKYWYGEGLSYLRCLREYVLLYAAQRSRYDIVRILRPSSQDLSQPIYARGMTLLEEAIVHKQSSFCYSLLSDGVHFDCPTSPAMLVEWVEGRPTMDLAAYFIPKLFHHMLAICRNKASFDPTLLLPLAVKSGMEIDICVHLLESGADINATDSQGWTALQHAVSSQRSDLVGCLLEFGASTCDVALEKRAHTRSSGSIRTRYAVPLSLSIEFDDDQICELLLRAGADVNACSPEQCFDLLDLKYKHKSSAEVPRGLFQTALQCAVWENNRKLIFFLISRGARLTVNNTIPCIIIAAWRGNCETVEFLLQLGACIGETYPSTSLGNADALAYASYDGDLETLQMLIAAGADVNPPEIEHRKRTTALQIACQSGNIATAEFLLFRGADVNAPCDFNDGVTALQAAVQSGNDDLVVLLLNWGADVNAPPSKYGYGAVSAAIQIDSITILRLLIANGADVTYNGWDVQNGYNGRSTPLVVASSCGRVDFILEMLEAGLKLHAPIDAGSNMTILETAISESGKMRKFHVVRWFIQQELCPTPSELSKLLFAVQCCPQFPNEVARIFTLDLLDRGADVNAFETDGHFGLLGTALSRICDSEQENPELVQLLLDRGANVNPSTASYPDGRTWANPLVNAISHGHISIVRLLLKHNANVNAPADRYNFTALQTAAFYGYIHIAQLLLAAGADAEALGFEGGLTALHLAVRHGRLDMVKLLLDNHQFEDAVGIAEACHKYAGIAREKCQWAIVELLNDFCNGRELWNGRMVQSPQQERRSVDLNEVISADEDPSRVNKEEINEENIDFNPWESLNLADWAT